MKVVLHILPVCHWQMSEVCHFAEACKFEWWLLQESFVLILHTQ